MKILTVSTLFPFANNPKHGIFIETRLRQLMQHFPDVEAKVIAPVPYFPLQNEIFGSYAQYAKAPLSETRHGIEVYHPRYLVIPKIGMTLTPTTLAHAIYKQAKKIIDDGYDFDLIDGHYFYPDGVAIAEVAKKLNKPFTVTARGTDINLIPEFTKPRKQIQQVFTQSNHNMAVCEALRQEMIKLGAESNKVTTLRNGVDLKLFSFTDSQHQIELRKELNLPLNKQIIISVGHLIERKGHHFVIETLTQLPDIHLLIAGEGPEENKLKKIAVKNGVNKRVNFLGSLQQADLARYYGASNLLVLASSREGWANVLLEALACGTPVVATNIWGTPEVIQNDKAGVLVQRDATSIAQGISAVLGKNLSREETRQYAETFSWETTIKMKKQIFSDILNNCSNNI